MEGKIEFIVFCIENIADRLQIDSVMVYDMLTKQSRILNDYIIPNYEVLHTQGKAYIVDDIIEVMQENGICL